jgi:hypothetical protein
MRLARQRITHPQHKHHIYPHAITYRIRTCHHIARSPGNQHLRLPPPGVTPSDAHQLLALFLDIRIFFVIL